MALFDLDDPQYTGRSFSFSVQDTDVVGFCITADGLNLYTVGTSTGLLRKYIMTTAFDPSTLAHSQTYDPVTELAGRLLHDVECSPTGDIIIIFAGIAFLKYDLGTTNDLTTIVYDTFDNIQSDKGSSSSDPAGFTLSSDGKHCIAVTENSAAGNNSLFQHISCVPDYFPTVTVSGTELPGTQHPIEAAPINRVRGAYYIQSGQYCLVCGDEGVIKFEFLDLNYYYAASDANFRAAPRKFQWWRTADIAEITTAVYGVWVSAGGAAMFLLGDSGTLYEYNLTLAAEAVDLNQLAFSNSVVGKIASEWDANNAVKFSRSAGFDLSPNGLYLLVSIKTTAESRANHIAQFNLTVAYDLNTMVYNYEAYAGNSPQGIQWNPNGSVVYVNYGYNIGAIREFQLSNAWDFSSNTSGSAGVSINATSYGRDLGYAAGQAGAEAFRTNNSDFLTVEDLSVAYDMATHSTPRSVDISDLGNYQFPSYALPVTADYAEVQDTGVHRRGIVLRIDGATESKAELSIFDDYFTHFYYGGSQADLVALSGAAHPITSFQMNGTNTALTGITDWGDFYIFALPDLGLVSPDGVFVLSDDPHPAGLLLGEVLVYITLFNDSAVLQTVTSFLGPSEITFSNFGVTTAIPAGTELIVEATVPKGLARGLDLTYQAAFDNSDFVTIFSISYNRPVLWAFPHQWSEAVQATYEWSTALSNSIDKVEQRRRLRGNPRVTFRISHLVNNDVRQRLAHYANYTTEYDIVVPTWNLSYKTTAAIAINDTRIFVDNSNSYLQVDSMVVIFNGNLVEDMFEISVATATYVDLKSPIAKAYIIGTEVFPATLCRVDKNLGYKSITNKVGNLTAAFLSVRSEWVYGDTNPLTVTYQPPAGVPAGVYIFDLQTYRAKTEGLTIGTPSHTFDPPTAFGPLIEAIHPNSTQVEQVEWFIYGDAKIKQFMEWLSYTAGSYGEFWYIPERNDLDIVANVPAATTLDAVVITDNGLSDSYIAAKGGLDIAIETYQQDGLAQFYYRSVTQIAYNAGTGQSALSIDTAIHATTVLTVANIKKTTIMRYARLASDKVPVSWVAPNLLQVRLGLYVKRY